MPRSSASRVACRKCYRYYSERNLLVSSLFYGSLAMLFFGAHRGRYRMEMALSFPLVVVMAVYFAPAFKPDSAAQRPEIGDGVLIPQFLIGE